jgi:hypothetical protein
MKTIFVFAALISIAALPLSAHPQDEYGVFWKSGKQIRSSGRQDLPQEIWRFAFVSKFRW